MTIKIIDIANRFIAEQKCLGSELNELKKWLSDPASQSEVEQWLSEHWEKSPELNSEALIENVYSQIEAYRKKSLTNNISPVTRIVHIYQKIAAILMIPMLGIAIYYLAEIQRDRKSTRLNSSH